MLLKTSWGIVIFLDIEELKDPEILVSDIGICENIYLRINYESVRVNQSMIKWISQSIVDLSGALYPIIKRSIVCYNIKSLNFPYTDFQEEGLYYAVQEALAKYYKITLTGNDAYYDRIKNKYIFPHLDQ